MKRGKQNADCGISLPAPTLSADLCAGIPGKNAFIAKANPSQSAIRNSSRSGQTMIFMIMILIILSFIVLWNFDLHTILHLKSRTQNAGDAAALAAARWQGITLNLIGDLNIMQAVVLSGGDTNAASQIAGLQARLCFIGPALSLMAAQQAAKNNGIYANNEFSANLAEHANAVLTNYADVFTEPYSNCWQEYSTLLQTIAGQGVAAGPDNAQLYTDNTGSGHYLLLLSFYDAIAGRDWCWFYFNAMDLLDTYRNYEDWPALPPVIPQTHPINSEIFGLGLRVNTTILPGDLNTVLMMNQLRSGRSLSETVISNQVASMVNTWYVYNPSVWTAWNLISVTGDDPFPEIAAVRPQYDYAGADAAIRIEANATRLTPGATGSLITWTAAAKPFGYLTADGAPVRPDSCSLVLPAFHSVRLIPADTASGPAGGAYNLSWRDHIENHLPSYMENGLSGLEASCEYCRQLDLWENATFRDEGRAWLSATNSAGALLHPCEVAGGPGGSPSSGGRRRGH
jgi:Flp pilus assembly protein TadG